MWNITPRLKLLCCCGLGLGFDLSAARDCVYRAYKSSLITSLLPNFDICFKRTGSTKDNKECANYEFYESKSLVLPTILIHTSDIAPDGEIDQANQEAYLIVPMGRQYEFLAIYAKQQDVSGMELCIE